MSQSSIMRRRLLAVLLYATLLVLGLILARHFTLAAELETGQTDHIEIGPFMISMMGAFILLSAIPFVPGVEIGFGLLVVLGAKVALNVYTCMVIALCLAYLVGRFVPARVTAWCFDYLGFERARDLIKKLDDMPRSERLKHLTQNAPNRAIPFLLRHRYVALAVVLNLPGNALIGGGGGIAMAAGLSRVYSVAGFLITVLIAVSPIPLLYLLM